MRTKLAEYPWVGLSRDLAAELEPALPAAQQDIVATIAAEVPPYAGALRGEIGVTVERGVDIALRRLLELFGEAQPALDPAALGFYRRIGAWECREGRTLDALLLAYRLGSRLAWQHMSAQAQKSGVQADSLALLAESIFVYIDELSAASADGHAEQSAATAGLRDVVKSRLAQALIDGASASDPVTVQHLADAADWRLPTRMAVAIVPMSGDGVSRLPVAPAGVLVLERGEDLLAVLPDPSGPGRRGSLTADWGDSTVYVGTVRPPEEAPVSLAHAVRVRRLAVSGVVPDTGVVAAADHLPELVANADEQLLEELRLRVLKPLLDVPESKREVLTETLAVWLALQGDRAAVARALVVHPQTVSYRLGRLRDLFGDTMDRPHGRWALSMVLGVPSVVG